MASFVKDLRAVNVAELVAAGVDIMDDKRWVNWKLMRVRDQLVPAFREYAPEDAERFATYAENLFEEYLGDPKNFEHEPSLLHADFVGEHIKVNTAEGKVTGVIDWGGTRIGDPDYELWRAYSHYGKEFMDAFLAYLPHPDPERLYKKLDFYYRLIVLSRALREIKGNNPEGVRRRIGIITKQMDGPGYFEYEIGINAIER